MYCKDINKKKQLFVVLRFRYIIFLFHTEQFLMACIYQSIANSASICTFQFESCLDIIGIQLCRFVSNKQPNRANLKYIITLKTDFTRDILSLILGSWQRLFHSFSESFCWRKLERSGKNVSTELCPKIFWKIVTDASRLVGFRNETIVNIFQILVK